MVSATHYTKKHQQTYILQQTLVWQASLAQRGKQSECGVQTLGSKLNCTQQQRQSFNISLTYISLARGKQGEKLGENGAFLIKFSPVLNYTIVVWSLL